MIEESQCGPRMDSVVEARGLEQINDSWQRILTNKDM